LPPRHPRSTLCPYTTLFRSSVKYGATDWTAPVYYFLLLTHILLAIVIVPFVLITFVRAWAQKFDKHRKIARYTLPLWLYVTASRSEEHTSELQSRENLVCRL